MACGDAETSARAISPNATNKRNAIRKSFIDFDYAAHNARNLPVSERETNPTYLMIGYVVGRTKNLVRTG